ncbi:unnamed protein product [Trichogramma brassicae]|uniref:Uncharacterized protein n=1 Tax=Trichogramma brassicae TaxID=86971 RepID=A0A6H5I5T6_9HYME|nr:unnamed protein product [Trichogramma brassicae]
MTLVNYDVRDDGKTIERSAMTLVNYDVRDDGKTIERSAMTLVNYDVRDDGKTRKSAMTLVNYDVRDDGKTIERSAMTLVNYDVRDDGKTRRSAMTLIRERTYDQKGQSKICCESERSSSVRVKRDILGDVYVGLTSTARLVRSYVARVKSASAGTSRFECARENQWIQRTSRPQGQPRVDLDQEKISTSCGESGGPALSRCMCESYAPTRPPGLRSSRLPSTGALRHGDRHRLQLLMLLLTLSSRGSSVLGRRAGHGRGGGRRLAHHRAVTDWYRERSQGLHVAGRPTSHRPPEIGQLSRIARTGPATRPAARISWPGCIDCTPAENTTTTKTSTRSSGYIEQQQQQRQSRPRAAAAAIECLLQFFFSLSIFSPTPPLRTARERESATRTTLIVAKHFTYATTTTAAKHIKARTL